MRFRKLGIAAALGIMAVGLAACGEKVEVPPAHVGKILTPNGWKPETIPPSKFRLDKCWAYCDRLVLAENADAGMVEEFNLFMPKDQLNMAFDIRFTISMRDDEQAINYVYDRIPAEIESSGMFGAETSIVRLGKVYETYGKPVIREVIRTVVADYAINEVASNRAALNSAIFKAVTEALEPTPLLVKQLAFADLQFPEVIVNAKIAAKEREVAIEQAQAEKRVALVQLQTELEKAKAQRAIRKERAEAALEENKIYEQSMTDRYLKYRTLEVLEAMAQNPNTVFLPYGALDDVGASVKMFNTSPK